MGLPAKSLLTFQDLEMVILEGSRVGLTILMDKEVFSIGRGEENDLALSDDTRVSRRHAEIKKEMGSYVIYNVSEKNYILVNGKTVEKALIKPEDQIQLGQTILKLQGLNQTQEPLAVVVARPLSQKPASPISKPQQPQYPQPQYQPQPQPQPSYQQPTSPRSQQRPPPRVKSKGKGGLTPFHYIIFAVVGIALFLMTSTEKKKKKADEIKTSSQIEEDMKLSQDEINKYKDKLDRLENSELSPAYRSAQEYFTRAMREFYNGQYGRAITAFQVVLNNDQNNVQAKYYFDLARRKFDQQVKDHMKLGLEYKEQNSWNKCQSHFSVVMILLQNQMSDSRYQQAKMYYDECTIAIRGRY